MNYHITEEAIKKLEDAMIEIEKEIAIQKEFNKHFGENSGDI